MKTGFKVLIGVAIVLIVLLLIGTSLAGSYNGLVDQRETVVNMRQNIDTELQRRFDLIPNLVNTVKGFASQEQTIINSITDARTKYSGSTTLADKAAANDDLNTALGKLLVVVENYPDLKSSALFTQLADELAGTENRIKVARKDYNDVVKTYNASIKKFPTVLIAGMFGFTAEEYFEATPAASSAPQVTF